MQEHFPAMSTNTRYAGLPALEMQEHFPAMS